MLGKAMQAMGPMLGGALMGGMMGGNQQNGTAASTGAKAQPVTSAVTAGEAKKDTPNPTAVASIAPEDTKTETPDPAAVVTAVPTLALSPVSTIPTGNTTDLFPPMDTLKM
jgi:hypothetical protein